MFSRLMNLWSYLKGDLIVLTISDNVLLVDAGKYRREQLRKAASVFWKETYLET